MAISPDCTICGQVESVTHQLLECANARNLWGMYTRITGKAISCMVDVIACTEALETEIIKSIIIKRLIQIDRSTGFTIEALKNEIRHYFRLEACVTHNPVWNQRIRQII